MTTLEAIAWMNLTATTMIGAALATMMNPTTTIEHTSIVGMLGLAVLSLIAMVVDGGDT